MGHTLSVEAAINVGLGVVLAFIGATTIARTVSTAQTSQPAPPLEDDSTPTDFGTTVYDIPPMIPAFLRTFDRPSSSAACTYDSGTSDGSPVTDTEESDNIMAPVAELLPGIGGSFTAKEEQVQNPSQVLG